jgi:2-polyprenyl-6-methoxyphenol hydroxylase-like FAD-dependent oxidoreductase
MATQVLIVGAGPVGMTLACELARYGVTVRIVDKAAQRTDKSKALVLESSAVAGLIQQYTGLLDPLVRPALDGAGIWLVRPDGYVACASTDAAVIGGYLARLTPGGAMN